MDNGCLVVRKWQVEPAKIERRRFHRPTLQTLTNEGKNYLFNYNDIYIEATEGETFTVNWGDGASETFTGGYWLPLPSHKYATAGTYNVRVESKSTGCRFTLFAIPYTTTNLTFFDCSAMDTLYCVKCQLSHLDLTPFKNLLFFHCIDSKFKKIDLSSCTKLQELYCKNNLSLSELILGEKPNLYEVECENNNLFEFDLSGCSYLINVLCNNNKLTKIDLPPDLSKLRFFDCSDNQLTHLELTPIPHNEYEYAIILSFNNKLQLSELYNINLFADYYTYLGTQNLSSFGAQLDEELFADQSEFEGIFTQYAIVKDGAPALESDYTITEGKLTFHNRGIYTVTMTNDAIVSNPEYPAKVVVNVNVSNVGITENQLSDIKVYPNPTTGKLTINNTPHLIYRICLLVYIL